MRFGISGVASHAGHRRCPWSANRATDTTNRLVRLRVRGGNALSRSAMAPGVETAWRPGGGSVRTSSYESS